MTRTVVIDVQQHASFAEVETYSLQLYTLALAMRRDRLKVLIRPRRRPYTIFETQLPLQAK